MKSDTKDVDMGHEFGKIQNFLFVISLLLNLFFFLTWLGIVGIRDNVKLIDAKVDRVLELVEKGEVTNHEKER